MTMPAPAQTRAPGSLRLVLTLALAGLLSGVVIIAIYESTLPTITANQARELREAVFKVLPGVSQMRQLVYRNGKLVVSPDAGKDEPTIYAGYDGNGAFVGYAIPAAGPGYQDTISLLYGFAPARGLVVGMEILASRETPGLGDKIYKDEVFVGSFRALAAAPRIVAVKKGTKSRRNEIDVITGATISSKAVVKIINEAQAEWLQRLPQAGTVPPLESDDPLPDGAAR